MYTINKETDGKPAEYPHQYKYYLRIRNTPEYLKMNLDYRRKIRQEMFDVLGGPLCKRCGFSDIRALQIDHVNGGGNKERKVAKSPKRYLETVRKNKDNYQVLCANCNWIKMAENKETGAKGGKYKMFVNQTTVSVLTHKS